MPEATHDAEALSGFFGVEVNGVSIGFFTSCSGLSVEHDIIEHKTITKEGKSITNKVPGRAKYSDITLKRGFTPDKALLDWFDETVKSAAAPPYKEGSIVLYTREFEPIARFNFINMFPSKLSVSDLTANSDEIMVEEVTMMHEELTWAT